MRVKNYFIKTLSLIGIILFFCINTTSCKEDINGDFAYSYVIDSSSQLITETFKLSYSNTIKDMIVQEGGSLLDLSGITAKFTGEKSNCDKKAIEVVKKSLEKIESEIGSGSLYNQNNICIRIVLPTSSPDSEGEVLYEQKIK